MHEDSMRHNKKSAAKGTDDMSSDASDEACFEHEADDLDPQAPVGRSVKFPSKSLFGDDGVPDVCDPCGVSSILQSYRPGRQRHQGCPPYSNARQTISAYC